MSTTIILFNALEAIDIKCTYQMQEFVPLGSIYTCYATTDVTINSRSESSVEHATGSHIQGKNNENVIGFEWNYGTILYFPKGLLSVFNNLKALYMVTFFKEIHQSDLKPFTKLVHLKLFLNHIEVLEEGLFDFNPDLEYINFKSNRISQIDPNIFDKLQKLRYLNLESNKCINMKAEDSLAGVKDVIQSVKSNCVSSEYLNLEKKFKNLEDQVASLSSEVFNQKLQSLEIALMSSKYADSKRFNSDLQKLRGNQDAPIYPQNNTVDTCPVLRSKVEAFMISMNQSTSKSTNGEVTDLTENTTILDRTAMILKETVENITEVVSNIIKVSSDYKETSLNLNDAMTNISENFGTLTDTIKENYVKINEKVESFNETMDARLDIIEEKIGKIESDIRTAHLATNKGIEKMEKKFQKIEEKLDKIMKAL